MDSNNTPQNVRKGPEGLRKSSRKSSLTEEILQPTTATKRRRQSSGENMASKNKRNTGDMNPTNAQLMSTLDKLAEKMEELPNKNDLRNVETELMNRMHQNAACFDKRIQDNTRDIGNVHKRLDQHVEIISKLEREVERQKKNHGSDALTTAELRRWDAREDKYRNARKSFRIWPVEIAENEDPEVCVRRFFIINMKVPASLAKSVEIEVSK